jgi:hypothetical protein
MKSRTTQADHPSHAARQATGAPPPDSELPAVAPPREARELIPHPAADVGGLETVPEDLLAETERYEDEADHAGLDAELPGEDQARETGSLRNPPPER